MKKMLVFFDSVLDGCATLAAWMMFAMALIVTYEVCVRYFFNSPTMWVNDFTDYIMLYSTFMVAAWLLKQEGHVRLTFLQEHLSSRANNIMNVINNFLGAIACMLLFYYGVVDVCDAIAKKIELARPIPVPKYLIIGVIPFGLLLFSLQFLRRAFGALTELKAKRT